MKALKRLALFLPLLLVAVILAACSVPTGEAAVVSKAPTINSAIVRSEVPAQADLIPVPVTDSVLLDAMQDPAGNVESLIKKPNGKWQIRLKTGELKTADFSVRQAIYKGLFASGF